MSAWCNTSTRAQACRLWLCSTLHDVVHVVLNDGCLLQDPTLKQKQVAMYGATAVHASFGDVELAQMTLRGASAASSELQVLTSVAQSIWLINLSLAAAAGTCGCAACCSHARQQQSHRCWQPRHRQCLLAFTPPSPNYALPSTGPPNHAWH